MRIERQYSCAYITEDQQVFLKPEGAFIYCVGPRKAWREDMMGIHTTDRRAQAAFIAKDMFKRRIKRLICDDTLPELLEMVKGLHEIDGRFNLAAGMLVLENLWHNIDRPDMGIVNDHLNVYAGKPCLIVAGGPSLVESFEAIRERRDKAIVIGVGSGVVGLQMGGIVPDYVVSIDPFDEMANEILPVVDHRTTLIADLQTNKRLVKDYPGPVVCYASEYDKRMMPELEHIQDIPTNTTASTSAFQFAMWCGFDPIVLIGMDFCYNKDRKHVADLMSASSKEFNRVLIDQDGNERMTNAAYLDTYNFMNMVLPLVTDRSIYNVRESGAGLVGTKEIHLKDLELIDTVEKVFPLSTTNIKIDRIAVLRSAELMLLKVRGYKKRFDPLTFDEWFGKLRAEHAYKYLAQHLDWVWFELDDKAAVLNRAEVALVELKRLLLGEVAQDA